MCRWTTFEHIIALVNQKKCNWMGYSIATQINKSIKWWKINPMEFEWEWICIMENGCFTHEIINSKAIFASQTESNYIHTIRIMLESARSRHCGSEHNGVFAIDEQSLFIALVQWIWIDRNSFSVANNLFVPDYFDYI